MKADLDERLTQLTSMNRAGLRALWQELFGQLPHIKLRRELLIPILAYRLQEKELGGLKPSTARKLRAMAEDITAGKKVPLAASSQPKAGTRIVREWQGRLHEVSAVEGGFEYKRARYRSLSQIAREITGTRWSGPAFFGLKKSKMRRTG